jgi:hypothetical protein
MSDELRDKYLEEWFAVGEQNLAYVCMWLGEERLPFIELDPWDEGPFWDHVSDIAEELFTYKASEKNTPLDNSDYVELAHELNNVLRGAA